VSKKFRIKTLKKAEIALTEAIEWYAEIDSHLAEKFLNEYEKLSSMISKEPYIFRKNKHNFHEAVFKTFPFLIIYRVLESKNTIAFTSIFHQKRNPKNKIAFKK
jgi:plasmid stabilization system protein ParE